MKLRACILVFMACAGVWAQKALSPDEMKQLLQDKKKNLFFLDVREPKELAEQGYIPGYVNIPIGQLESRLSEIPKDKTIVTA